MLFFVTSTPITWPTSLFIGSGSASSIYNISIFLIYFRSIICMKVLVFLPLRVLLLCYKLNDGSPSTDATQFRKVLDKLQYLFFIRPNISFAVNKLSQFMHSPKSTHQQVVKQLLRYLNHTLYFGLLLNRTTSSILNIYTDAYWTSDPNDRTSTSGYITFLGHTPVSWSLKKQRTITHSSTEVEYCVVAAAVAETNWLTNLLGELHVKLSQVPNIYCNNIGTTYLCQNPIFHSRMKYIAIDFYFVGDQVQHHKLKIHHIHSVDQLVDSLTKAQTKHLFLCHLPKLGVIELPPNLQGHNNVLSSKSQHDQPHPISSSSKL